MVFVLNEDEGRRAAHALRLWKGRVSDSMSARLCVRRFRQVRKINENRRSVHTTISRASQGKAVWTRKCLV
jgi:hypothetical protein